MEKFNKILEEFDKSNIEIDCNQNNVFSFTSKDIFDKARNIFENLKVNYISDDYLLTIKLFEDKLTPSDKIELKENYLDYLMDSFDNKKITMEEYKAQLIGLKESLSIEEDYDEKWHAARKKAIETIATDNKAIAAVFGFGNMQNHTLFNSPKLIYSTKELQDLTNALVRDQHGQLSDQIFTVYKNSTASVKESLKYKGFNIIKTPENEFIVVTKNGVWLDKVFANQEEAQRYIEKQLIESVLVKDRVDEKYTDKEIKDMIGKVYNQQKIQNIYRRTEYNDKRLFAHTKCVKCGREKKVFLSNLVNNPDKYGSCVCSETNVGGKLDNIKGLYDGSKKLANNTSGYTGVSYVRTYNGKLYDK